MRAAQIVAPRRFDIVDIADPEIGSEPPGSILVKTQRSALCGSDMPAFALSHPSSDYPLPAGQSMHECIGVIAASKSDQYREGDEVLAFPRGKDGLAEYFVAHETATVALPEHDNKNRMVLAQSLGTVIWACRKLGNLLNHHTVVVGQGPMGLLMAHMLSNLGARTVIATDLLDYRLAVSNRMGATHTINVSNQDAVTAVADITHGSMADLVVEVVGHQTDTINECLRLVKPGGTIMAFGVPDQKIYEFRFSEFFRKNAHFIGAVGQEFHSDVPLAIAMIQRGRIDVSPIITHQLRFTEAQHGFELSLHKRDAAIKIFFKYD